MKKRILLFGSVMLILSCPSVYAADTEVESLKQELNSLKNQVEELKAILKQQQQMQEEERKRPEKAAAAKEEKKESPIISSFKFKPYGYIKLDAA